MIAKAKVQPKQSTRVKTVVASFSVDPDFLRKVHAAAELEGRTFSSYVTSSLRKAIEWKTNDKNVILRELLSA